MTCKGPVWDAHVLNLILAQLPVSLLCPSKASSASHPLHDHSHHRAFANVVPSAQDSLSSLSPFTPILFQISAQVHFLRVALSDLSILNPSFFD